MTEKELTFSDNTERFGVTVWLSLVVFLFIASIFDYFVFTTEVSVIVSLLLTIPLAIVLLTVPIKET